MKSATLAFLLLLVVAHATGEREELLAQPLSMFRDGDYPTVGYALFVLLGVIAALMTRACLALRRELELGLLCLAGIFLLVIAVTPSFDALHGLCSFVLLGLLYSYFALLLHAAESRWLYVYLPAPLALLVATDFHSYGLWQKGLFVYFVVLINLRYHLLTRCLPQPTPSRRAPGKQRVVYVLAPGKAWSRRSAARTRLEHTPL